jgi:hypothetical protein
MESWSVPVPAVLLTIGMCGVPLAMTPGVVLEFDVTPKLVLLLWATGALLVCHHGWWAGLAQLFGTRQGRLFGGLLALQLASSAWGTLLSAQPGLSFAGSAWRRYGFVTQFSLMLFSLASAATLARWPDTLRKILEGITACSSVIALYAIAQYAGLDPFLSRALYTTYYNGQMLRVPGTLGHAVYLGAYLAACIPIAIGLGAESETKQRKLFWGAIAGVALLATVLCGARSALLGLAAGALVSLPVLRPVRLRGNILLAAALGVGLLLVIPAALDPASSLRLRLSQWPQERLGGPRLMVWRESLALVAAQPLAGAGPELFADRFRQRQSAELSRAYPEFLQESPHNLLLDGVISQGISFLLVAGGIVYLMLHDYRRKHGPAVWLRASVAATFVCLQFETPMIAGGLMLYGMLGLFVACQRETERDAVEPQISPPGWATALCYGLALLLLAAGIAYLRKDSAYADMVDAAATGHFERMAAAYSTTSTAWFPVSGDDLWASREFATIARRSDPTTASRAWTLAAAAAARAESTGSGKAEAVYQFALLAIGANQAQLAEFKLRQALEYAPMWYRPHLLLAQLLHYMGREAESKDEAARALDLSGSAGSSVEQTLRTLKTP